jgi:hypothetical protein
VGWLVAALALAAAGCAGPGNDVPDAVAPMAGRPSVITLGADDRLRVSSSAVVGRALEDLGDPPTAEQVIDALKRHSRPIGEVEVVGESEARFADTRLAGPDGKPDLSNGGVVAIKATPAEARAGSEGPPVLKFLLPPRAGYRLAQGRILIRLASRLSPEAVDRYAAALGRLRG